MDKRTFLAASTSVAALSLLTSCTTTGGGSGDPAAQRKSIDADVNTALSRLYQQAAGSQELVANAKGVLVFPSVLSGGLVVGGARGQGALRKGGKTAAFYTLTAGSVGLTVGAQTSSVFILFMTQDALNRFEASSGWTAGVDGSIALLSFGANTRINTRDVQQPIAGFVLTNAGLMADLSLNGTRITKLNI